MGVLSCLALSLEDPCGSFGTVYCLGERLDVGASKPKACLFEDENPLEYSFDGTYESFALEKGGDGQSGHHQTAQDTEEVVQNVV